MRKVIANEWMTLDGVVQAPSYADEDVSGGFAHGGWHARYFDDLSMNWVTENVRGGGGRLRGGAPPARPLRAPRANPPAGEGGGGRAAERVAEVRRLDAPPRAARLAEFQAAARRHRRGRARAEGGGGQGPPCHRQ